MGLSLHEEVYVCEREIGIVFSQEVHLSCFACHAAWNPVHELLLSHPEGMGSVASSLLELLRIAPFYKTKQLSGSVLVASKVPSSKLIFDKHSFATAQDLRLAGEREADEGDLDDRPSDELELELLLLLELDEVLAFL